MFVKMVRILKRGVKAVKEGLDQNICG